MFINPYWFVVAPSGNLGNGDGTAGVNYVDFGFGFSAEQWAGGGLPGNYNGQNPDPILGPPQYSLLGAPSVDGGTFITTIGLNEGFRYPMDGVAGPGGVDGNKLLLKIVFTWADATLPAESALYVMKTLTQYNDGWYARVISLSTTTLQVAVHRVIGGVDTAVWTSAVLTRVQAFTTIQVDTNGTAVTLSGSWSASGVLSVGQDNFIVDRCELKNLSSTNLRVTQWNYQAIGGTARTLLFEELFPNLTPYVATPDPGAWSYFSLSGTELVATTFTGSPIQQIERAITSVPGITRIVFEMKIPTYANTVNPDDAAVFRMLNGVSTVFSIIPRREKFYDADQRCWILFAGNNTILGTVALPIEAWLRVTVTIVNGVTQSDIHIINLDAGNAVVANHALLTGNAGASLTCDALRFYLDAGTGTNPMRYRNVRFFG